MAFNLLPVAPLPQVDFPTIKVQAALPGASPDVMGTSVATPLERQLGRIAGITEMTASSTLGQRNITPQFDLARDIDGAARDVQAAINAALSQLPANLQQKLSQQDGVGQVMGGGSSLPAVRKITDFSIIALIGIILLIGIVKKNAIMMIDFALQAERTANQAPQAAIYAAALLRFRPIMMTTAAALLGALPLILGVG